MGEEAPPLAVQPVQPQGASLDEKKQEVIGGPGAAPPHPHLSEQRPTACALPAHQGIVAELQQAKPASPASLRPPQSARSLGPINSMCAGTVGSMSSLRRLWTSWEARTLVGAGLGRRPLVATAVVPLPLATAGIFAGHGGEKPWCGAASAAACRLASQRRQTGACFANRLSSAYVACSQARQHSRQDGHRVADHRASEEPLAEAPHPRGGGERQQGCHRGAGGPP